MNKSNKLMAVLMTAILGSALFLTGCGEKPVAADVTAKALYNFYALGDSADIENIGLTKDEVNQKLEDGKSSSQSEIRTEFEASGLSISNEDIDIIYNAQLEAQKRLTVTTEIVSEDADKATVKVATNYVNINTVISKAQEDAVNEITTKGISSETEAVKIFLNKYIEGLKAFQPSTEIKEATFEFEKKTYNVNGKNKEIYAPVNMDEFYLAIANMAIGQ